MLIVESFVDELPTPGRGSPSCRKICLEKSPRDVRANSFTHVTYPLPFAFWSPTAEANAFQVILDYFADASIGVI